MPGRVERQPAEGARLAACGDEGEAEARERPRRGGREDDAHPLVVVDAEQVCAEHEADGEARREGCGDALAARRVEPRGEVRPGPLELVACPPGGAATVGGFGAPFNDLGVPAAGASDKTLLVIRLTDGSGNAALTSYKVAPVNM